MNFPQHAMVQAFRESEDAPLRAGPEGKICSLWTSVFFLIGSKYISKCTEDIDV